MEKNPASRSSLGYSQGKYHTAKGKAHADSINQSLEKMIGSQETPNITAVTAKDDFTHFTVTTTSTELGLPESMSVISFYMYGGMYGIFSGRTPDNIHVDFVNQESGEVIYSTDSSQLGQ